MTSKQFGLGGVALGALVGGAFSYFLGKATRGSEKERPKEQKAVAPVIPVRVPPNVDREDVAGQKVTVFGAGKLGLCWCLALEEVGYDIVGVDIFPDYVEKLNSRTFNSCEPHVSEMLKRSKNFRATLSAEEGVEHSDIIYIFVQTPSTGGNNHYDHSLVGRVLSKLNSFRVKNKHIIIGCTVMPGYTDTVGASLLEDCTNCTLNYNPEFIAQGDIINGMTSPDMVLIGQGSEDAGRQIAAMHLRVAKNEPHVAVMSPSSAEICKLSVNCFVTTKISFANMIGDIADRTPGANKIEILKAVGADSRVGGKYLKPGYGYGGPCFPRDNLALAGHASKVGIDAMVSHATDNYNKYHTDLQVQEFLDKKTDEHVIRNVAYKDNCTVPIIEESRKLDIAYELATHGRKVTIVDRSDIVHEVRAVFGNLFEYRIDE